MTTESDAPSAGTPPTHTLVAGFAVTAWEPASAPDGIEGDWVGTVVMRKEYTSGLVGTSVAQFLSSGDEESRAYLAVERITGTLDDGRTGSFTVYHGGLQAPAEASAFGYIVPGTGTGDFAAFAGPALISHNDDGPYFTFTLS